MENKIQQGFSRAAKSYDLHTGLHRAIADKVFLQVVKGPAPSALLDVGCGTGYLTARLKDHFLQSKVIGLDLSPGMIEAARSKHRNIEWVLADGHDLPFSDGSLDSVVSNLAYQWSGDLSRAFSEARRVLRPNGSLVCTLFGYKTCGELFRSLDEAKRGALQFDRLPDELKVRQALATSGFNGPIIDSELIELEFADMYELIGWIKSIGANNLSRSGYLGPETISRAAFIYQNKFPYLQGVAATFEVIRIYAKR